MKDDLVNDTISRAAALDALDKVAEMFPYRIPGNAKTYRQYNEAWSDAIDAAENALEALPSAQLAQDLPNGCTDTISRQSAIDVIERLEIPEDMCVFEILSHIELEIGTLPSAQPDVPDTYVGDMISRQAAINAICEDGTRIERQGRYSMTMVERKQRDVDILENLPSAQPGWIPCSEKMPPDYQWYYATCKSLVDNRENWVVEGCYTPWEHFNSTPMIKCGEAEVIAWMPKGFPEPWEGDTDAH